MRRVVLLCLIPSLWLASAVASPVRSAGLTDEYIKLEADLLRPGGGVSARAPLASPGHYRRADGSALVLGRHTPAGFYLLEDGRTIEVAVWPGHQRYSMRVRQPRGLGFCTVTRRRAGLLVDISGDSRVRSEASALGEYFHMNRGWLGGVHPPSTASGPWAAEIHRDWYPSGFVQLPDRWRGQARITWIAFDRDERPLAIVSAERRIVQSPDGTELGASPPEPGGPKQTRNARVLGSALVDLWTGRVVERSGDIR